MSVELLDTLLSQIKLMDEQFEQPDAISRDGVLSTLTARRFYELCFEAICSLRLFVDLSHFGNSIYASPPLREDYFRIQMDPQNMNSVEVFRRPEAVHNGTRDDILHILETLARPHQHFCLGYRGLIAELEFLIQCQPTAKSFISAWLSERISMMGALLSCVRNCQFFEPWFTNYRVYVVRHGSEFAQWFHRRHGFLLRMSQTGDPFWSEMASMIREDLIDQSKYPVRQPCSREVVNKLRKAEMIFNDFWDITFESLEAIDAISSVLDPFSAVSCPITAPWVEPRKLSKKEKEIKRGSDDQLDQVLTEAKEKARSTANGKTTESVGGELRSPPFHVDKRTFRVFRILLFDGPDPCRLEEISWNDFVHAMVTMDFTAVKFFGSAWFFSPVRLKGPKTIIFHEPYMGGKLTRERAKFYGQRLRSAYNLDSDMFKRAGEPGT